jgi:hypothetical protein
VNGADVKIDNKLFARGVIVLFALMAAAFIAGDIWSTMRHGGH